MKKNFELVKSKVSSMGLSPDTIVKVLDIIEFAQDNDVELYVSHPDGLDGKLRMRYTGITASDHKSFGSDALDGLMDIFGMGKKK